jgi:hypothetical protein
MAEISSVTDAVLQAVARGDSARDVNILMNETAYDLDWIERRNLHRRVIAALEKRKTSQ